MVRHRLRDAGQRVRVESARCRAGSASRWRAGRSSWSCRPTSMASGRQDRRRPLHRVDLGDQRRRRSAGRSGRRARRPSRGSARCSSSHSRLCSRANSVCRPLSPSHQLSLKPVSSRPCDVGRQVAGSSSRSFAPSRSAFALCRVGAVDLRAVPPVRGGVGEEPVGAPVARRRARSLPAMRISLSSGPPGVFVQSSRRRAAARRRRPCRAVAGVVHPVVHLELDPRGGQDVQRRRRAGTCRGASSSSADRDRVGLVDRSGR